MGEKLKQLSAAAFGIVMFLALLSIPAIFFLGSTWAVKNLQSLIVVGWVFLAVDLLVFLPLSIFGGLRGLTGTLIFISSFVFVLLTWLLSFILTHALWGLWAVIIGILFFGGAVVPFALLARMFKDMWEQFFSVLVLFVLTFGSPVAGIAIAEKQ
jgi:hypothetical protein